MQIDIAPETERLVRDEISLGHFRSVDELIHAGVEAWREKNREGSETSDPDRKAEPFWKSFTSRMHALPGDVFDQLPADGSAQHDHYLYGSPKKDA